MSDTLYWIWLLEAIGRGNPKIKLILEQFASAKALYEAGESAFAALEFLSPADVKSLTKTSPEQYEKILTDCERLGIHILTYDDDLFPARLKQLDAPPVVLYTKGDMTGLDEVLSLAVVGTRKATEQSMRTAGNLAYELSLRGVVIVSGCAVGIDMIAHVGALKANARTVSVLGTGLDKDYPGGSMALKQNILSRGGALLSEHYPGAPVSPANFPVRNRLMAGLTLGTLVVEASEHSGALITAEYSLDQGKEVFCVPPPYIYDQRYDGVKRYLRQGAIPMLGYQDVLDVYESQYGHTINKTLSAKQQPEIKLDLDAQKVYDALERSPQPLDKIFQTAQLPAHRILAALTELETKKLIKTHSGRRYSR